MPTLDTIDTTTGFARASTSDILDAIDAYIADGGTLDDIDDRLATALSVLAERPGAREWLEEHGLGSERDR